MAKKKRHESFHFCERLEGHKERPKNESIEGQKGRKISAEIAKFAGGARCSLGGSNGIRYSGPAVSLLGSLKRALNLEIGPSQATDRSDSFVFRPPVVKFLQVY